MLESVQYRASGGQPAVSAELRIDNDRDATLFAGTSWSVPPQVLDRVGRFADRVTDDEWAGIQQAVDDGDLTRARIDEPDTSPDPATRAVILTHADGETRLTVSGAHPPTAVLEERLLSLMGRLVAQHPQATVSASMRFDAADGTITPHVTLAHAGTEPLALLLFSDDDPAYFVRLTFVFERSLDTAAGEQIWLPAGSATLARDDVAQLVERAGIPKGVHEMPPGSAYEVTAPPIPVPDSPDALAVRTRIEFWYPDGDTARTRLQLELPRQPLEPAR